MQHQIWTIGHSTRTIEEFIEILKKYKIQVLIDVRSLPGSTKYPHFNSENLEQSLHSENISYLLLKKLGGLRKKKKDSKNTAWRNLSFRNYADYMETSEFKEGIFELKEIAIRKRTCIMCAEAVWWRCHRSMIADYLKSKNWTVEHILSLTKSQEHPYTAPAHLVNGMLSYEENAEDNDS